MLRIVLCVVSFALVVLEDDADDADLGVIDHY